MYAVIFTAKIRHFDDEYFRTVAKMKELAFSKYGCIDFVSVTQGDVEVAISYWETQQQIRDWKKDPEHKLAQQAGASRWYGSFSVEICEVKRSYRRH